MLTDVIYKKGEELVTEVTWQEVMERCKCNDIDVVWCMSFPCWDEFGDQHYTHFLVFRVIQGMNMAHSLTTGDGKTIMR